MSISRGAKAILRLACHSHGRSHVERLECRRFLSAGQFDPSFFNGGAANAETLPGGTQFSTALQSDGKIIVAGTIVGLNGSQNFGVARFNANGSLDRGFAAGGRVSTNVGGAMETPTAVAIQQDGKIVVVGTTSSPLDSNSVHHIVIVRYLSTGKLDGAFGSGGVAKISFTGDDQANAMVIQPNGDIIVGGSATKSLIGSLALARLTPQGTLDANFGNKGEIVTGFSGGSSTIQSIALQKNGAILVAGTLTDATTSSHALMARFQSNGSLDRTFGTGGKELVPNVFPSYFSSNVNVAVQTDGKIILGAGDGSIQVARYTPNGAPDYSFGDYGVATISDVNNYYSFSALLIQKDGAIRIFGDTGRIDYGNLAPEAPNNTLFDASFTAAGVYRGAGAIPNIVGISSATGAVVQSNGNIVIVGESGLGSWGDCVLTRITPTGAIDNTFGYHGVVQTPNGLAGGISSIAVQSNGKIITAGGGNNSDGGLARYNTDGTLDSTFGAGGIVNAAIDQESSFDAVAVQSNGDIIAAGYALANGNIRAAIARFLPNGTPDAGFGKNGIALTDLGDSTSEFWNSIEIQSNGDIVAVGGTEFGIFAARFLPNGTLDPHFGKAGIYSIPDSLGDYFSPLDGVAIQTDGKIDIAANINNQFAVIRLTTAGLPDMTFGTLGVATSAVLDTDLATADALAIDASGNIVVGGADDVGLALARFLPNGKLDASFGAGGVIVDTSLGMQGIESLYTQLNGGIIVGGLSNAEFRSSNDFVTHLGADPPQLNAAVARFTSKGLDTTFGDGGSKFLDPGVVWNSTNIVVAPEADGKILAAANFDVYQLLGSGVAVANPASSASSVVTSPIAVQASHAVVTGGATSAAPAGAVTIASSISGGAAPMGGLVIDSLGNMYGTASMGGASGDGTVFEIIHGTSAIITLASFNGTNGADPVGSVIFDAAGDIFGTTANGGNGPDAGGDGTVFEIVHGAGVITTIASFNVANGVHPMGNLVLDSSGNLFGTTRGTADFSQSPTVFEVVHGSHSITTLAQLDNVAPNDNLVIDSKGNIFGATEYTLFELPSATRQYTDITPADLNGNVATSGGLTIDSKGNLYFGSVNNVVKVTPGSTTSKTLASLDGPISGNLTLDAQGDVFATTAGVTEFDGFGDPFIAGSGSVFEIKPGAGASELANMLTLNVWGLQGGLVIDPHGNVFGAGSNGGGSYNGAVFEIVHQTHAFIPFASFGGANEANSQSALIADSSGNLFGTSSAGGANNVGTVFEIPKGKSLVVIASFNGANGEYPMAGLTLDLSGNLYGTTSSGGAFDDGTVFEIPAGKSAISVIASFNNTDGNDLLSRVILDGAGNLYGSTAIGGANGDGTLFMVSHSTHAITTLASFNGTNGNNPVGDLIMDSSGTLYGATAGGGANNDGNLFKLAHGAAVITTIANFNGSGNGANPDAGLVMDSHGNLFGTTNDGGAQQAGTIFEVVHGGSQIKTLGSFNIANGANPGAIILDAAGDIFGTTFRGGSKQLGTVVELAIGATSLTTLLNFAGGNGQSPDGGLLLLNGNLFGDSSDGGPNGGGTVFELPL